jgi:hypothetical protein
MSQSPIIINLTANNQAGGKAQQNAKLRLYLQRRSPQAQ